MKTTEKRVSQRTVSRKNPKKSPNRFLIYMAICVLIVLASQMRIPRMPQIADPGTIRELNTPEETGTAEELEEDPVETTAGEGLSFEDIPEYSGSIYTDINDGEPAFTESDKERLSISGYEYYSALDGLGRCGYCEACVGPETQPESEERGEIWEVHPSGWRSGQGWERCHLIAWALTGENANDHNLVTGTHQMNVDGMLPFEIEVAEAADKGKHVMYRVSPIYNGFELIPRGVHMEAESIEDDSVSFNVFVYNVEDGKIIDYRSGYMR